MEAFIEEIYQQANLYTTLREIQQFARVPMDTSVISELQSILPCLEKVCSEWECYNPGKGKTLYDMTIQLTKLIDKPIEFADLLEIVILPQIEEYLKIKSIIEVVDEQGYCLLSSSHGFITIKDTRTDTLLHSSWDPMYEAKEEIELIYDPIPNSWAVLGCGLGYQVYQLYKQSEESVEIYLFENNAQLVDYAFQYGVLSWIPKNKLHVVIGEDLMPFLKAAEECETYYIFKQEIQYWSEKYRSIIKSLFSGQISRSRNEKQMRINFFRNTSKNLFSIENLIDTRSKDEIIVVAGGPSLDDNIQFLKERIGRTIIIAVGTVLKKLVNKNIIPDYVSVLDPLKYVRNQLNGVENCEVPVLMATSAYWGWGCDYKGKKYLIPIHSQLKEENDYAEQNGIKPWDVGGTVTLLAIKVAMWFGAKRIYLIGADFAYPNGQSHALGTSQYKKIDIEGKIPVKCVNGSIVYTDYNLNTYRLELEELISNNPQIRFINLSKTGAYIDGAEN